MDARIAQMIRVSKRVTQAAGFLELNLSQKALDCLHNLGPLGPFEAEVELLRGEAFRRQRRFQDAAKSFSTAVRRFVSPQDQRTYLALSACFQQVGDPAQALQMLARARGADAPKPK